MTYLCPFCRQSDFIAPGFHQLAANPLKGKDCSDICSGYRKHPADSHVIFYRQLSNYSLEVVRVLHGRMDIETRLSES